MFFGYDIPDGIGTSTYSTSGYLIPLSAILHGFGWRVSEDFYKYGRSSQSVVKTSDDMVKVYEDCKFVNDVFNRGYFKRTKESLTQINYYLNRYFKTLTDLNKPTVNYFAPDFNPKTLSPRNQFILKNVNLMLDQKPLDLDFYKEFGNIQKDLERS